MNNHNTAMAIVTVIAIASMFATPLDKAAAAYLKIKNPDTGEKVSANKDLMASGTSAPSNDTRTRCSVQLQLDQQGYNQTSPMMRQGTEQLYTVWSKLIPAASLSPGPHSLEGQLMCLAPGTNTVNYVKHLVHNFTAINGPIPSPEKKGASVSVGTSLTPH